MFVRHWKTGKKRGFGLGSGCRILCFSASLVPTFSFGENFTFTPGRPNGEGTDLRKVQDKILNWTPPGRFPLIPLLK